MPAHLVQIFDKEHLKNILAFTTTKYSDIHTIPEFEKYIEKNYPWVNGLHYLQQIHSTAAIQVYNQGKGTTCYPGYDALYTFDNKEALIIQTADCLPIFLTHPPSGFVGLIHAGWRGIYQEIFPSFLKIIKRKHDINLSQLHVEFGPFIRECCFEVGEDVKKLFLSRYNEVPDIITSNHINLQAIILFQCRQFNIPSYQIGRKPECTVCHKHSYFSYRREGQKTGRLYSVIVRKE